MEKTFTILVYLTAHLFVREFKYLRILFASKGRRGREIGRRVGGTAAVMLMVKSQVSIKSKALNLLVDLHPSPMVTSSG